MKKHTWTTPNGDDCEVSGSSGVADLPSKIHLANEILRLAELVEGLAEDEVCAGVVEDGEWVKIDPSSLSEPTPGPVDIRLRCLQAAASARPGMPLSDIMRDAAELEAWVKGEG